MIGIDTEILDKIIKINSINLDVIKTDTSELLKSIESLKECYSGLDLNFAFAKLLEQQKNLNKIINIINNYSVVLSSVKTSYIKQDINIVDIMNRTNSRI